MAESNDAICNEIEQQTTVYIEAMRYLATCGRFSEEKFNQAGNIFVLLTQFGTY